MKILQICSYYTTNKLYKNLFEKQEELGIENKIFVPVGNEKLKRINEFDIKKGRLIYSKCFSKWDRFIFSMKQKKMYDQLKKSVEIKKIDFIHAHTLFTNGKLAYNLKKEFNKKYIVAVRNTDLNIFFKYFIWLRKVGINILLEAEKIILITPIYEKKLMKYIPEEFQEKIQRKIEKIPNGMENFWFENKPNLENKKQNRLLFVGSLDKNKRILDIIESVIEINNQEKEFELHIVGDGPLKNKVIKYSEQNKSIKYLGRITDLKKMKKEYEEANIFVMPSKTETFGIVYLEALSQGCKVIYTKGEGIDGFKLENAYSLDDIKKLGKRILEVYEKEVEKVNLEEKFYWKKIGAKYSKVYKKIVG